jgi:formate C-acetyltransferase
MWNGGANYYTVAQISLAQVDAGNGLMAVKDLVFDRKKLTMAKLKEALAANWEGHEDVRKIRGGAQVRQRHRRSGLPGSQGE